MPALKDLQEEMRKLSTDALGVVEDAKMTIADKKTKLDGLEADIKKLSDQIADENYLAEQRKKYQPSDDPTIDDANPMGLTNDGTPKMKAMSLGEQMVAADEYKNIVAKGNLMSANWTSGPIELKATLTTTSAGGTTGSGLDQPTLLPGIMPILFQPLMVEDLIPGGATGTALVRYLKETVATNTAAAVAETGTKPAATLNFSAVDEPVRKIAETLKVTDEMFADVPQIRSYIDNRLMLFIRIATEAALLSGAGAPSLTGLLQRSGLTPAQALASDTVPDAVYKDITKIRIASFLEPDGIVMHPNDWQGVRLAKDQNLQYYGGGPFTGAYGMGGGMAPDTLWGKRVVVTTAMTENTALVGAFAQAAQIFNRGGMTVEATNANEDDFLNNLIALRCERRLALAVYRPSAFSTVTGI